MYVYRLQCTLLTMQQQKLRRPLVAQRVGVGWIGLGQGSAQLSVPWNLSLGYRWQIEAVNASQLSGKRLKQAQRKQKMSPVKYGQLLLEVWHQKASNKRCQYCAVKLSLYETNAQPGTSSSSLPLTLHKSFDLGDGLGLVESSLAAHGFSDG